MYQKIRHDHTDKVIVHKINSAVLKVTLRQKQLEADFDGFDIYSVSMVFFSNEQKENKRFDASKPK